MSDPTVTPKSPLPPLVDWILTSAARHLVTGFAGVLLTAGAIQPVQQDQFVLMGTSICIWLAGLAWSAAEKKALTSPPS